VNNSGEAKLAIYERVSSEEQKTKETIVTQDEFLGEFVALYGLEVVKVYKDEAISGTVPLGERPAGAELLSDAASGLFDAVLVYRLDRIGRSLLVVVDAHDRLEQAGVALKSATEPIDTSTPPGRLIFQMLASFSEFERETINERTRDGKNRAYRGGAQPGLIPYGYDIDDSGAFVVVEDEARVVEQVIGNVAAGATLFAEAKRLNLEGVPSPGKKYRGKTRRTGTTWSPTAISRLVGRRAYGGTHVIRSSAGEIEREVPPIVAEDLRLAAAARLTDNKRFGGGRPVRPYLLRGLIKCEECAWNYCGVSRKAKDGYRFRYACPVSSARRFDPSAVRRGCPTIDALWLEDLVWEDIRRFVSDPGEALARAQEQSDLRAGAAHDIEGRLADLRRRLHAAHAEKDRYVRLYAAGHLDDAELDTYLLDLKNRTTNLGMLIDAAQGQKTEAEHDARTTRDTAVWLASLQDGLSALEEDTAEAHEGRRELLSLLVERISVGRDEAQPGKPRVRIDYRFAVPAKPGDTSGGITSDGNTNHKTFEILTGEIPIPEALGRL
jgi:site-specific DNA recombinase